MQPVPHPSEPPAIDALARSVRAGDRLALARAITLAESTLPQDRAAAEALIDRLLPHTGQALRLGISGPPGVGKSTLIEALGLHAIAQGRRVAVLAVDPSSRLSGGAILGDKTRMSGLAREPAAFIRPSPAGPAQGGVAPRTREALLLCEAAGFDLVIVETVGVGQGETAAADMVDLFVVLVQPAGGDELQGMKRGILELADLVVVTKADGALAEAAARTLAEYRHALRLLTAAAAQGGPRVESCSALTGAGIGALWSAIVARHDALKTGGALAERRRAQARA
ncbi:MAG: methylmalonyl Co-A mutase-associated GTPase MeaB, partial [Rhodospirillaceae bacterium]|nr:methylmalonyl Co-A mutase-associated GTPase MeaB [Rhodospirillaceae bacterium]